MANIVFDFLHNYQRGERRESEPATVYQYDEGHVLEAILPEVITSAEIHYWIRGMETADAYVPTSITPNGDNSCTVLGNIPNKYFETNGELRVYIVVNDESASITTYEGKLHICQRSMPDDYVDDDPENEATRILTEAQAAATTATQQAQAASDSAGQAQQSAETLSGSVAQIATNTQNITQLQADTNTLKEDLSEISEVKIGFNKADPSAFEGKTISYTGVISDSSDYTMTGYIPADEDDIVYSTRKKNSDGTYYNPDNSRMVYVAEFDATKTFLRRNGTAYVNGYQLGEDTKYIRVVVANAYVASGMTWCLSINSYPINAQGVLPYEEIHSAIDVFARTSSAGNNGIIIEATNLYIPENQLNTNDILTNTVINSAGAEASNTTCFTTNYYIPAEKGDVISYAFIAESVFYHKGTTLVAVAEYNENKEFLVRSSFYVQDYVVTNTLCKYIRVCVSNGALSASIASVSVNAIPTKASITEYEKPFYSAVKPSQDTIRNRKVLWLGTSIPTYGYPQILARFCGANMHNEAIGSSGITQGITSNITAANVCGIASIYGLYGLTQTVAEKQTMINNWSTIASEIGSSATLTDEIKNIALASSYETIVDPYLTGDNAVDLIVINHAYNDNTENAIAPENDKLNPHYLEGAYNWLIKRILEANPNIGIVIFGHYSDLPTSKETALQNVADRWNIPYYLLKNDLGWSNTQTITTSKRISSSGEWTTISPTEMTVKAMWLGDGIHPLGVASKRIAQVSQNVFADWLKMYCNN